MDSSTMGKCLWAEDDCTLNDPDRETLAMAYKKITGVDYKQEDAKINVDVGDGIERHMPTGFIVWASYPGNSAIYKPVQKDKE